MFTEPHSLKDEEMALRGRTDYTEKLALFEVPEHLHAHLLHYILRGTEPGGFLTAVLTNDLMGAVGKADEISRDSLFGIVTYLYNVAPVSCHGSAARMAEWMQTGGVAGILGRRLEEHPDR